MSARTLYHGTWAGLAAGVQAAGLQPRASRGTPYVYLAGTEGLAWAAGVWRTASAMAAELSSKELATLERGHPFFPESVRLGRAVFDAMRGDGHNLVAVASVHVPDGHDVERSALTGIPQLPWETFERQAPCYRSTEPIPPAWIVEWRLFRVPELIEAGVVHGMIYRSESEFDRSGADAVDDALTMVHALPVTPVGPRIPNCRALLATVVEAGHAAVRLKRHGLSHWSSVADRGLKLHPDADLTVVLLFSFLHDAARIRDGHDPGHAERAAELAQQLNGHAYDLTAEQLGVLTAACAGHTDEWRSDDPTIAACWDADRLDKIRYPGVQLDPRLLSTDRALELVARDDLQPLTAALPDVLAAYRDAIPQQPGAGARGRFPVEPTAAQA